MAPPTDPTNDPTASPTARTAALALLGLPETATEAQIVHAYRRLVRATHPDVTGRTDPQAAREFAAIHNAYQRLTQRAENQVENQIGDPVEGSVGSSRQGLGDESAAAPEASRRPPMDVRAFGPRPPLVAGPVVVTPLREQHRPHRRGTR
jgi:curved DNA-binding protein CbpA